MDITQQLNRAKELMEQKAKIEKELADLTALVDIIRPRKKGGRKKKEQPTLPMSKP